MLWYLLHSLCGTLLTWYTLMRNLQKLEDSALMDMLAEYTQRYTYLFKNVTHLRYDEDFQRCKRTIQFIMLELEQRKRLQIVIHLS